MQNRHKLIIVIWIIAFVILGCGRKQSDAGIKLFDMNPAVSPGDDFYEYANGAWLKANSIPEGASRWGALYEVHAKTQQQMKSIVDRIIKNDWPEGSEENKIKTFYLTGMDTITVNGLYLSPIQHLLDDIDAIESHHDFCQMMAKMHALEIQPFFYFFSSQDEERTDDVIPRLYQAALGLADNHTFSSQSDRAKVIQEAYLGYIQTSFELLGHDMVEAEAIAVRMFNIEKSLASISMGGHDLRDPRKVFNRYSMSDLPEVMPHFKWPAYLKEIECNYVGSINVSQPRYFVQLDSLLKELPLTHLRHYLTWSLLSELAPFLAQPIADAHFHFNKTVLRGIEKPKERHNRVLDVLSEYMGEALGKIYVQTYFQPQAKSELDQMVQHIKTVFEERICQIKWMEPETKAVALEKLQRLRVKVGSPEQRVDYTDMGVGECAYVENRLRAGAFAFNRDLAKIGGAVNRDAWEMLPQTVNAYYHPVLNEIAFPAAFLQAPIYSVQADDAYNYGSIGVAIAHEMSHGFDDEGRHSDPEGILRNWWTKEDEKRFAAITEPLINYYNSFEVIEGHHINGQLTLGENIADLGGLTIAFQALKEHLKTTGQREAIDGFTPEQRFFLAYAQTKHELHREKSLIRRLKSNVHPPSEYRVLGPLPHLDAFYEAFDVSPADKMYISPSERIAIW
ncbi:M13 family metallopeptidase [bacterium]|nr:M13 family metallopeptidase [bacterium]